MIPLTQVTYLYRDASNYKFRGDFCVLGKLCVEELKEYLFDGEFFIPERIGLPALRPEVTNDDDHFLHSLEDCKHVEGPKVQMTAGEFRRRLRKASQQGWF